MKLIYKLVFLAFKKYIEHVFPLISDIENNNFQTLQKINNTYYQYIDNQYVDRHQLIDDLYTLYILLTEEYEIMTII